MTPSHVVQPLVSVIVPARNCSDQLRDCLQALQSSDYPAREVIVVDDASTDDTCRVAESMGARCLRLDRCSGPALARNRGAEVASGEFLLFLDADVCAHPDTIRRAVEVFQSDRDTDAVFGSYDRTPREHNLISLYKNLY